MHPSAYRVLLVDGTSGCSAAAAPYGREMAIEHVATQAAAFARLDVLPSVDAVVIDQGVPGVEADVLAERITRDPTLDGARIVLLAPDAEALMAMPLLPSCDAYLVERDPTQGMTLALAAVRLFSS